MSKVEEVKQKFGAFADMLNFIEEGNYIVMKPKQFLGSDNFAKIAALVRNNGGEYISAGKESHFRMPRGNETQKQEPQLKLTMLGHLDIAISELQALRKEMEKQ